MKWTLTALVVALGVVGASAQQAATPLLDQLVKEVASLRTAAPPPVAAGVLVMPGANLQAALDAAAPGATLLLAQGATYKTNLALRNKVGTATITIRTIGLDDTVLPPGVRLDPSVSAAKLAKLTCDDCFAPVLAADAGAHDYTFIGVEFAGSAAHPDRDVIQFGVIASAFVSAYADQPSNITFDRVYVHGDPVAGGHRGLLLDGKNMKLVNSHVGGFWEVGRDSQAVLLVQAAGPVLIENNFLEASGENFLTGGADPKIAGAVPSDITFRGNWVFKPLAWKAKPGMVKNLFELKNARRVLVEGNVFENNWADSQSGNAILFSVRNQDGTCPWCTVQDVLFQNNVLKNGGNFALNVAGTDNNHPSAVMSNVKVLNNLFDAHMGPQLLAPITGFELGHNTFLGVTYTWMSLGAAKEPLVKGDMNIHDNVTGTGEYGINGTAVGLGIPALEQSFVYKFTNNVLEATAARFIAYPPGTILLAPGTLAAKLDPQSRYLGTEPGSDGKKPGADIDALRKAIPWLVP
jgi:hypothetical protein